MHERVLHLQLVQVQCSASAVVQGSHVAAAGDAKTLVGDLHGKPLPTRVDCVLQAFPRLGWHLQDEHMKYANQLMPAGKSREGLICGPLESFGGVFYSQMCEPAFNSLSGMALCMCPGALSPSISFVIHMHGGWILSFKRGLGTEHCPIINPRGVCVCV